MTYILIYILIGVIFTALLDIIANNLEITPQLQEAMEGWGVSQRVINIIIWPISLLIFIWVFNTTVKK